MTNTHFWQSVFPLAPMVMVPANHVTRHALPPFATWAKGPLSPLASVMRKRLVFGGDWDLAAQDCGKIKSFQRVHSLAEHLPNYRASLWYIAAISAYEKHGYFRHKNHRVYSIFEIDTLFEQELVPLVSSMRDTGYRQRPDSDVPLAMIGRNGEIIKTEKGRHRFAAAQAVGCKEFPLRIAAVHKDWLRSCGLHPFCTSRRRIVTEVRALELAYQAGPMT